MIWLARSLRITTGSRCSPIRGEMRSAHFHLEVSADDGWLDHDRVRGFHVPGIAGAPHRAGRPTPPGVPTTVCAGELGSSQKPRR
jgi:hypothetical protein